MKKYTNQYLIQIIKDYYQKYNKIPSCSDLEPRREVFRNHFGSYRSALCHAGLTPPEQITPKPCLNCEHMYKPKDRNSKFCSRSCSAQFNNVRQTEITKTKRRTTNAAKLKSKPPYTRIFYNTCICCSRVFISPKRKLKTCSTSCYRNHLSIRAIQNPKFGGNCSRKIVEYTCPHTQQTFRFDSSWERALAIVLDQLNIQWSRPTEPFLYQTNTNTTRRYFPDFYIPSLDLYIDTKNPWRIEKDMDKLLSTTNQHPISLLIIGSVDQIIPSNIHQYVSGLHIVGADGGIRTHE